MPPATKFQNKTMYHSQLVKASPLTMMFTGRVRDSKFEGKPPFISCRVKGSDMEHHYQVENDLCRESLEVIQTDKWYEVRAEGSREGAILTISAPITGHTGQQEEAPSALWEGGPEGEEMPAQQKAAEVSYSDRNAARYLGALEAARFAVTEYSKRHGQEPSETIRNIATTIFIQNGRG